MNRFSIFFLISVLLFSCQKEESEPGLSKITVTGIKVTLVNPPGARVFEDFNWPNPLPPQLPLVFNSKETGQSYPVILDTNFESGNSSFELPLGSYTYESLAGTAVLTNEVMLRLSGDLFATASTIQTELQAESDYTPLSFQKTNLSGPPRIILPELKPMATASDFYYIYAKKNTSVKIEIPLSNGRYFRFTQDLGEALHQNYYFRKPVGDPPPIPNSNPFFNIFTEVLTLQRDLFPEILYPFRKKILPTSAQETSGLEWIGDRLFTINDSQNTPEILELNPETGAVIRTIRVTNAANDDWEDLTASDADLFIANLGNNGSTLPNKTILKIPIPAILTQNQVSAEKIILTFTAGDGTPQPNFKADVESMVYWGDRLHLFTKPATTNTSQHFSASAEAGPQVAIELGTIDAPGKLTSVDISPDGRNLVFIGYETTGITRRSFLMVYPEVSPSTRLASSASYTFWLGLVTNTSQTEAIAIQSAEKIKISGEQFILGGAGGLLIPPRLMEVDLKGIIDP